MAELSKQATAKIRVLKQENSVQQYVSEFVQLAFSTGLSETALMSQYRSGLREDIKDFINAQD